MKKQFDEKKIAKKFSDSHENNNRGRKDRYSDDRDHKGENWRVIERKKTNQRRKTKNRNKRSQGRSGKSPYDKW